MSVEDYCAIWCWVGLLVFLCQTFTIDLNRDEFCYTNLSELFPVVWKRVIAVFIFGPFVWIGAGFSSLFRFLKSS